MTDPKQQFPKIFWADSVDKDAEIARLRAALERILAVCNDNISATCRHDLALLFIADIARHAPAYARGEIAHARAEEEKP